MLPSTGYFKGINCPFYDSGLCERPYCHFRHVKKDSQNTSNESIESGAILQKLVSAAVQKVLQQTEASGTATVQNSVADKLIDNKVNSNLSIHKATYNPTPISELNKINNSDTENNDDSNEQRKRHIPVPYTPRKPANLLIKRPVEDDGYSKPFIYIPPTPTYTPGSTENIKLDQYTPKGGLESNKYLPGSETELEKYKPLEIRDSSNKFVYVPSDKCSGKKKVLEYKPAKLNTRHEAPSVSYQPTPRSLVPCFSSDEDDEAPDIKKRKLSTDLNGLDELGPEFDILDQILDEEKSSLKTESKIKTNQKTSTENLNKIHIDIAKDYKLGFPHNGENENPQVEKIDSKISRREKIPKKEKSVPNDKDKHSKSRSSDKKSSSKTSTRAKDKDKECKADKYKEKDKKHSSSSKNNEKCSKKDEKSKQSRKDSKNCNSKDNSTKRKKSDHHKSQRNHKKTKDKQKKTKEDSITSELSDNSNCNELIQKEYDEELLNISESDEENIELQCKKIFEEYVPTAKPNNLKEIVHKENDLINENQYIPTKKRISRTVDKDVKIIPKAPLKPDFKVSAARTMAERLAKNREFHAAKNSSHNLNSENPVSKTELSKSLFYAPNVGSSKIRIAHVPYASTLVNAKRIISPISNVTKSEPSTSTTIIQTVKKGTQRIAHMPNDKFIDRPGVLEPLASKIPANVRSTYLNMMIDICIKIYLSVIDAYARAQHEELITSKKCSTVQIYKNSAVLTISRLKKELYECNGVKKSGIDCSSLQKGPQNLIGKVNSTGSWSIENKGKRNIDNPQEFSGAKLYNNIKKWILTEQQLQDNGFPRVHPSGEKGRAVIYQQKKQNPPKGYTRTCCRCKKDYTIDKKGFAAIKEECIYHPNNKYRVRGEARYQCCSQDGTSDGCCIAPNHVYEYIDYENLKGFVQTLPPESQLNDDYGVYSLDCEMCYTTHGLDLTRITVINSSCKVVYETFIKPLHPIIDYNTRYSGITEEHMVEVKTSLLEVQATLLTMFNNKTILIGHSLESDFKALKLIHDTVIDTSVLFPHKMGPPYKRALKNLSSEHLKKIIQNSVDGHDSAEDATVCMELIHYKLKEDLKTR